MEHVQPIPETSVLIILDGNSCHKKLVIINYTKHYNIHMTCISPNNGHKLQPLDQVFMKPFKTAFSEVCGPWMRQNPGLQITKQEVACLVFPTCIKACHLDVTINGFNLIGIFTLNPGTFSELHFVKSLLTDVRQSQEQSQFVCPLFQGSIKLQNLPGGLLVLNVLETAHQLPLFMRSQF
jgi:hypothetical protein